MLQRQNAVVDPTNEEMPKRQNAVVDPRIVEMLKEKRENVVAKRQAEVITVFVLVFCLQVDYI